uniref:Secreted protein n=1 Tax=Heligmosomoides polygyrus TaxID=6339 RepID=A0A183GVZ0_HELPZ
LAWVTMWKGQCPTFTTKPRARSWCCFRIMMCWLLSSRDSAFLVQAEGRIERLKDSAVFDVILRIPISRRRIQAEEGKTDWRSKE